ncbi:MAG: glycosyltransferase [Polaromonas sp.]
MDLQSCQSGSRLGGIGRYSIELAKAMAKRGEEHDFFVVLNSILSTSIPEVRSAFSNLIPQDRIKVFDTPPGIAELTNSKAKVRAAELIREKYISTLNPDVLHITSLFEGLQEDVITSVDCIFPGKRTAVTLYDLIPLIQRDRYLANRDALTHYLGKVDYLKKSGLLLAISDFSKKEAIDVLGIEESAIVNISSAADKRFEPLKIKKEIADQILKKYGISKKFLMYTGSFDQRKNHANLIKAFGKISYKIRKEYQLVIVGNGWDSLYADLNHVAKIAGLEEGEVVFAGHVHDSDLLPLYNLCYLFVFPSLAEGFGLPVLEAMSCGIPTICSNCTSLPEVIGWADAMFDPKDTDSIAKKMHQALTDANFRRALSERGLIQAKKFSWDESARKTIQAFEESILGNFKGVHRRSGILEASDNSLIINKIADLAEISILPDEAILEMAQTIASNQYQSESTIAISEDQDIKTKTGWVTTWNTKCGIASYSKYLIDKFPGKTIIFAQDSSDLVHDDKENVLRCWKSGYPDKLDRLKKAILKSEVESLIIQFNYSFFDFPAISLLLQEIAAQGIKIFITFHSTFDPSVTKKLSNLKDALLVCEGLIVHSMNDVRRLRNLGFSNSISFLPQGIVSVTPAEPLDFNSDGKRVLATYGFALPSKGLIEVLDAFSRLIKKDGPIYHLLMINAEYPDPASKIVINELKKFISENHIDSAVTLITDYLADETCIGYLKKADLVIYAYQETGESSSAAVRMGIAAQKPILVSPSNIFKDVESAVLVMDGSNAQSVETSIRKFFSDSDDSNSAILASAKSSKLWVSAHSYESLSRHLFWLMTKPKLMRLNYVIPRSFIMTQTSDKLTFTGESNELKSSIGERIGNVIKTSGRAGHLLFGPYLSVAPGVYTVEIFGEFNAEKTKSASIDIAIKGGSLILASGEITGTDSEHVLSILSFTIPEGGCTDLEVRIIVDKTTEILLSRMDIFPALRELPILYFGSDNSFGTQAGRRVGRSLQTTKRAGFLLFGPYLTLEAGAYEVKIFGSTENNNSLEATIDAAISSGNIILAQSDLHSPNANLELVTLQFSLENSCTDLEIRIKVTENSSFKISTILFAKK